MYWVVPTVACFARDMFFVLGVLIDAKGQALMLGGLVRLVFAGLLRDMS